MSLAKSITWRNAYPEPIAFDLPMRQATATDSCLNSRHPNTHPDYSNSNRVCRQQFDARLDRSSCIGTPARPRAQQSGFVCWRFDYDGSRCAWRQLASRSRRARCALIEAVWSETRPIARSKPSLARLGSRLCERNQLRAGGLRRAVPAKAYRCDLLLARLQATGMASARDLMQQHRARH
jgi:hypothetical protein